MLWKEAIYLVLDEIKAHSDDAVFTEEHIMFLLNKYRAFILKKTYSDIKKLIPEGNYQTLCLDLIEVPAICGLECEGGTYLRSTEKIPNLIGIGNNSVYPMDYFHGIMISYISRDRMKYTGYNKYMQNIIYTTIGPDGYLYFKSNNPQFLYLEKVRFTGIFEDAIKATEVGNCKTECDPEEEEVCDIYEKEFPLEYALMPQVVELIVKELLGAEFIRSDDYNNAHDGLPEQNAGGRR